MRERLVERFLGGVRAERFLGLGSSRFMAAALLVIVGGVAVLAPTGCTLLSPTTNNAIVIDINRDGVDDRCPAVALSAAPDVGATATFVLTITAAGSADAYVLVLDGAAQEGEVASGSKVGPLASGTHTLRVQPVVRGVGSCPASPPVTVVVP